MSLETALLDFTDMFFLAIQCATTNELNNTKLGLTIIDINCLNELLCLCIVVHVTVNAIKDATRWDPTVLTSSKTDRGKEIFLSFFCIPPSMFSKRS